MNIQATVTLNINVEKLAEIYDLDIEQLQSNTDLIEDLACNELGWLEQSGICANDLIII